MKIFLKTFFLTAVVVVSNTALAAPCRLSSFADNLPKKIEKLLVDLKPRDKILFSPSGDILALQRSGQSSIYIIKSDGSVYNKRVSRKARLEFIGDNATVVLNDRKVRTSWNPQTKVKQRFTTKDYNIEAILDNGNLLLANVTELSHVPQRVDLYIAQSSGLLTIFRAPSPAVISSVIPLSDGVLFSVDSNFSNISPYIHVYQYRFDTGLSELEKVSSTSSEEGYTFNLPTPIAVTESGLILARIADPSKFTVIDPSTGIATTIAEPPYSCEATQLTCYVGNIKAPDALIVNEDILGNTLTELAHGYSATMRAYSSDGSIAVVLKYPRHILKVVRVSCQG